MSIFSRFLPRFWRSKLLSAFKARVRSRSDLRLEHCLAIARAMAGRGDYALLVTTSASGPPNARVVEPILDGDTFTLWIGAHPASRKVAELHAAPKATLAFVDRKRRANLVMHGEAVVDTSLESRRKFWLPRWRLFFPEGPSGDDYVVLKFTPARIELMSFADDVVAEPFGLTPVKLVREIDWRFEEPPKHFEPGRQS